MNKQLLDIEQKNLRLTATASASVIRPQFGGQFPTWSAEPGRPLAWGRGETFFGFSCQNAQSPLEKPIFSTLQNGSVPVSKPVG